MKAHAIGTGKQLGHADVKLPESGEGAQLASEFAAFGGGVIVGAGFRIEDHAVSAEEGPQGKDRIVCESAWRERVGQIAAESVNAAGDAEDRIDGRVAAASPQLVAPVKLHVGVFTVAAGI